MGRRHFPQGQPELARENTGVSGGSIMSGWLKLWRELKNKPIWKKSTPDQCKVMITLLMMTNYERNEWEWGGEKFSVEPGQMVTSIKSIRKECGAGISTQNVRTALSRFARLEFLTDVSTKYGRLITILNWDTYQAPSIVRNTEPNKDLTKGQHLLKKDKKDKKFKEKESPDETSSSDVPDKPDPEPKGKKKTNPDVKLFIDWYHDLYAKRGYGKLHVKGAKDGNLVKSLLSSYSLDELKTRAQRFFDDNDNFVAQNREISKFALNINRYGGKPEQLGRDSGRPSGKKRPAAEMFGPQERGNDGQS
jgi:hypothetical protein